jgi:hypothetical protein
MINGLGQQVCDSKDWVPELSYFEKMWNFALCNAIGGMVGYPGYEHPRTDKGFRYHIAQHAQNFMIGTKPQLQRYRKYARQYLDKVFRITKRLRKNPEQIFKDPWTLMSIQQAAHEARQIAENVQAFAHEPEDKEPEEPPQEADDENSTDDKEDTGKDPAAQPN